MSRKEDKNQKQKSGVVDLQITEAKTTCKQQQEKLVTEKGNSVSKPTKQNNQTNDWPTNFLELYFQSEKKYLNR